MVTSIDVSFLPGELRPGQLHGAVAVAIDVLRATTTMAHALAAGANAIMPCETIDQTRSVRTAETADRVLLGGERGGVRIDGFDLSNSPADYTRDVVAGATIAFTTTNGTKCLLACRDASSVFTAAFVNLSAVVDRLLRLPQPLQIVCAGTDSAVTAEDVLCAGLIAKRLNDQQPTAIEFSDAAQIACGFFDSFAGDCCPASLESALRRCKGGQNLVNLGYDADIRLAAEIDSVPVVPQMTTGGLIQAARV